MEIQINQDLKRYIRPLSDTEYEGLESSCIADGIRDVLVLAVLPDGKVLADGHNRYEIAKKHGLDFNTIEKSFYSLKEVKAWMLVNQLSKRNLTKEEESYYRGLRYRLEKDTHGGDRKSKPHNGVLIKSKDIGDELGVSKNTIERDGNYSDSIDKIASIVGEDVKNDLLNRTIKSSKKDITELAKQEPEKIIEVFEQAKKFKDIKKAKDIIKTEEVKESIELQKTEIRENVSLDISGTFDSIAIDPPWPYGTQYSTTGRRVANPYPEMSIEEIKNINLPDKEDGILFLWTTHKFIFDAKEILSHWGYDYKGIITWDKEKMGMGHWLRMQCEFCLIGIKGKPFWGSKSITDIIREPRREHSRKPEKFYSIVEEICAGSKLEYFSRTKRVGWEVFGNDVNKFRGDGQVYEGVRENGRV